MLVASVLRTNRAAWIWSAKTTTQPRPRSSGLDAACRAVRMLAGPSGLAMARVAHRSGHHDRLLALACSRSSRYAVSFFMVSVPWITTAPDAACFVIAVASSAMSPIARDGARAPDGTHAP